MSIEAASNRKVYTGDGVTVAFPTTFQFLNAADLVVLVVTTATGVAVTKTLTTHYTVAGGNEGSGAATGTVTMLTAPTALEQLVIYSDPAITQPVNYTDAGAQPAETQESSLDRLTLIARRVSDQITRCLRVPEGDTEVSREIPNAVDRASSFLAFDADGVPISSTAVSTAAVVVSDFVVLLLADETAALARSTLDAQQSTTNLTEDTAPAVGDFLPTYDISAAADKKALLGAIVQGALEAKGSYNLGLANATTTVAADSVKIQGAAATLSATNPLYINLPTISSPGRVTRFSATADVTIKITGAHWGLDTNGDFTGIIHRVYAVNDNGTLKWGVSNKGGLRTITDTSTSATPSSITTQAKMLVNSALSAGTWPCREVGWFLADFDDTGGAAENLWALQTSAGAIMVGVPAPVYTDWAAVTLTTGLTGGSNTITAYARQQGDTWHVRLDALFTAKFTGGTGTFTFPSGKVIDTTKTPGTQVTNHSGLGRAICNDVSADPFDAEVFYNAATSVIIRPWADDTGASSAYDSTAGALSTTAPFTWDDADRLYAEFSVPVLGWSGN